MPAVISLIVARDRNGAIGKDGRMPWSIPEDMAFFRRETIGGAVIMGRRTWESIGSTPLGDRLNCVVSSDDTIHDAVFPNVEQAVSHARSKGHDRLYGIGGTRVYGDLLPIADRLLITEIDLAIEDPDTYFPTFDETAWSQMGERVLRTEAPRCVLRELTRPAES